MWWYKEGDYIKVVSFLYMDTGVKMANSANKGKISLKLTKAQKSKLDSYADEIKQLIHQTVMSAIRIGEILNDVKTNILPGNWEDWVDTEFPGDIHHDSANNFINAYKLFCEYGQDYTKGIQKLPLSSLYIVGRSTTEPEIKETILKLAEEEEPMSREEVKTVIKTYRKIKLQEAGFSPASVEDLVDLDIAENPKEIKALSKLSVKKKEAVTSLLSQGQVETTKEALKHLKTNEETTSEESIETVEVVYTPIKESIYNNLQEVPTESVDLAIIEAPFKLAYVERELPSVSLELERILNPGGFLIHFLGHKAIMYAGDALAPLHPLHVLCLRKTPGKSKYIIGANITSASVLAAFAYKPPYKAPKQMIVDLQTVDNNEEEDTSSIMSLTQTEALPSFDDVPTGIEIGIERMMMPLVDSQSSVLHAVLSNSPHFNIYDSIYKSCLALKVPYISRVHEK